MSARLRPFPPRRWGAYSPPELRYLAQLWRDLGETHQALRLERIARKLEKKPPASVRID